MSDRAGTGVSIELRHAGPIHLDVSFTCRPGEVVALVGPSGAGKTTILRAVAGLFRPATARIICDGEIWSDTHAGIFCEPHERRVGMVFQSYALFPHLSALGNVEAALSEHPLPTRRARAHRLLDLVQLEGLSHRRPAELSGGQQQRVALARALAREPRALLLDEPLSAVDRRTRRRLREVLTAVRSSVQAPIILVTHDLDEAAALADRLVVIDRGQLLQDGSPSEVLASPNSDQVRDALDLAESR